MARTVNAAARAIRHEAFLDAAQRLIQARGYEQMSVQDVLDELDASRGAFYHYFDSKAALLEAVVERMVDVVTEAVAPVVADPGLPALTKLERLHSGIVSWKAERTELMLAVMQVWLSDDNALVREKFRQHVVVRLTPPLATIMRQGKAEGVFSMSSPDDTARVLVSHLLGTNEVASQLFVARQADAISFEAVERTLAAYKEAYERILGVPAGSLKLVDGAVLRQWYG